MTSREDLARSACALRQGDDYFALGSHLESARSPDAAHAVFYSQRATSDFRCSPTRHQRPSVGPHVSIRGRHPHQLIDQIKSRWAGVGALGQRMRGDQRITNSPHRHTPGLAVETAAPTRGRSGGRAVPAIRCRSELSSPRHYERIVPYLELDDLHYSFRRSRRQFRRGGGGRSTFGRHGGKALARCLPASCGYARATSR